MGDPIPKDTEWGGDCAGCEGSCFDAGETPKYMGIVLTGVIPCGLTPDAIPNGHLFIMIQSGSNFCDWSLQAIFDGHYYEIYLYLHETYHRMSIEFFMDFYYSIFVVPYQSAACQISIANRYTVCGVPGVGGANGSCELKWGPDINEAAYLAQDLQ
jgi:hypothetical protein